MLVVRVHPELLKRQKLPPSAAGKNIWKHRFKEICAFERHISRNGMLVLKFHLRISKEEQRKRFLGADRRAGQTLEVLPWSDVAERRRWNDYMAAYEDMIRATSTDYAPCYVVPADHKRVDMAARRRRGRRGARRSQTRCSQGPGQGARRAQERRARAEGRETGLSDRGQKRASRDLLRRSERHALGGNSVTAPASLSTIINRSK